jgi:hypothetical protein
MAFAPQRPVYLKHPHFVGLCGDGSNVNDASGQIDQERHVVRDQPTKRPDFDGEEVGPYDAAPVGPQKHQPRRVPARRGLDALTLEHVGDGAAPNIISLP